LVKKNSIAETLGYAFEPIRKEGEKRRSYVRRVREIEHKVSRERADEPDLKQAVFAVMDDAVEHVSGGGRLAFAVRKLFYAVRPRIAEYTSKELGYEYFRDTLVTEYQRTHGKIRGLYFEPRGVMYEPHSGTMVQLGTREVDAYDFPVHLYNKLLYVEKTGMWPTLQDARLAERWDMAVATGSGYATTAARTLLAKAEQSEHHQIFVLHDADHDGYNIARTVRGQTWRMPDHNVEVIDLGLTIADAEEMDLSFEEYTRKKKLPAEVEANLTERERECFVGEYVGRDGNGKPTYRCWRVELDAMTAPQTVEYIERKLLQLEARGKVIPPDDYLADSVEETYREEVNARVRRAIERLLDVPVIQQAVADELRDESGLEEARRWIEDGFVEDAAQPWRKPLRDTLAEQLSGERNDRIEEKVRLRINEDS
jgi:hypothetical protein